jgi:predicted transcriptional regulator
MASLVRFAKTPESKTHLMYKCNLSFRQVDRYLNLLVERGLLEVVLGERRSKPRKFFVVTNRGRSFLKAYHVLKSVVAEKGG